MEIIKKSPRTLNKAFSVLKKGGVVIYPTDTVYGFLADASNKKAVKKIYKIKKRLKSKPLPLFVKDLKMAKELAEMDARQEKILRKFWPGKYTFVLKKRKPGKKLYGVDKRTIAIRVPKYAFLNKLLKKFDNPLVQTSVNISGQEILRDSKDIIKIFRGSNILIINAGKIKKSKPSHIVDLTSSNLIRLR